MQFASKPAKQVEKKLMCGKYVHNFIDEIQIAC